MHLSARYCSSDGSSLNVFDHFAAAHLHDLWNISFKYMTIDKKPVEDAEDVAALVANTKAWLKPADDNGGGFMDLLERPQSLPLQVSADGARAVISFPPEQLTTAGKFLVEVTISEPRPQVPPPPPPPPVSLLVHDGAIYILMKSIFLFLIDVP